MREFQGVQNHVGLFCVVILNCDLSDQRGSGDPENGAGDISYFDDKTFA